MDGHMPDSAVPPGGPPLAAAALLQQLAQIPQFAETLHALGKVQYMRGATGAAVKLFEAATRQRPGFALAENDLGVALRGAGCHEAALAAFERAVAAAPGFAAAHCNRGLLLLVAGDRPAAETAFRSIVGIVPTSAADWRHLATAYQHLWLADEAEAAWRSALALDPMDGEARLALGQLLDGMHRPVEAQEHYAGWVRRQDVHIYPCVGQAQARVLVLAGTGPQNTPTTFLFPVERFETIAAYLLPPDDADAASQAEELVRKLPEFDIVFNAISDADKGADYLPGVAALCRRFAAPILNPPDAIPRTRRDRIGALLEGIPDLTVPTTRRITRSGLAALADAAEPLARPVLLRPAGTHGGSDLTRVERSPEIADYLSRAIGDDHYVSDFHDYRSADGYFRKYRFAFIDREVFAYHLAIGEDWLIHYFRTPMSEGWMRREEEAFLADYEAVLPGSAVRALREVARRVDLDCAGMDCALLHDGRVLLFEANASMNLQLGESRAEFPYKHRYVPRVSEAAAGMVRRRLAQASWKRT